MRTGKSYRSCQRRVGAGQESRTGAQRVRSAELHSALPRESRWKPAASRRSNFFVLRRGRVLAALAGLLLLAAPAGQAQFSFSTNAGIITLTQYYGYDSSVTIPDFVNIVGDRAFYFSWSLTNVTIPNSVTTIGDDAFALCLSLTNVTIPNSVTTIGDGAFMNCYRLTSVTIPDSVTSIGYLTFAYCTSLTNVTIPDSVTSIGGWAFIQCYGLTSVTIPNSVTNVGEYAFGGCNSLTNVTIPNSVTSIGDDAFLFCSNLVSVYFQGNAPSADCNVFSYDPVTVYYLPGTTGWGTTFACVPTAPWTLSYPLVLNSASGFGVQSNGFGFTISWATNLSVVVEAATDLANPVWTPLATNPLVNGTNYFSDPNWTNYPGRFYRIVSR